MTYKNNFNTNSEGLNIELNCGYLQEEYAKITYCND